MSENKKRVSSIEELVNQAKEFAASHGGVAETKIGSSAVNSGNYVYRNGKTVQESSGWVEIELKGQNNSSTRFFLEDNDEKSRGSQTLNKEFYQKVIQELAKHGISHRSPSPIKRNENPNDEPERQIFSALSIPCSSLEEVKKQIKDFYQKNREEINKKPDFSRWVEITEIGLFSKYSEVGKNGETITSGPHNTATILLKGADQMEGKKITNQWITLLLKLKSEEWGDETVDWPEKELKEYWNILVEQKETPSAKNLSDKIEQLGKEISELENDPQTKSNSKKQKESERKKNELNELLLNKNKPHGVSSNQSGGSNLVIYLIGGGIILLVGGLFLVKLLRKRKKL